MNHETLEQHYWRCMPSVKAQGFHEPISLTPDWQTRVDALYARIQTMSGSPEVGGRPDHIVWPGMPGMLKDGRMACLVETCDPDTLENYYLFAVTE